MIYYIDFINKFIDNGKRTMQEKPDKPCRACLELVEGADRYSSRSRGTNRNKNRLATRGPLPLPREGFCPGHARASALATRGLLPLPRRLVTP
jgi:hypothetical protein